MINTELFRSLGKLIQTFCGQDISWKPPLVFLTASCEAVCIYQSWKTTTRLQQIADVDHLL